MSSEPQEGSVGSLPRVVVVSLLLAYGLSGGAALVYEVSWMRELSTMLGSTAYASGIMLSAFMTGLGVGTLVGTRIATRTRHPLRGAAHAELAVAIFSVVALLGLRYLPGLYFDMLQRADMSGTTFLAVQFVMSFLVMVLPTLAMGVTYPLVIDAVGRKHDLGGWAGRLYSANTAGAIAGSLAAAFLLIPSIGLKGALITAAVLSSIAAIVFSVLSTRLSDSRPFTRAPEFALIPLAILALIAIPGSTGQPLGLGQVYFYDSARQYELLSSVSETLYEEEGVYSRVTVTENRWGVRTLSNGALDEGNSGDVDRCTTTMLALAPTASTETTGSALIVGLGTGYTSQAYRRLGFDSVTTVEINPEVLPASTFFIGELDQDERWKVIVDDARAHLLTDSTKYDAITSEPSWPWSSGVAALFTQEFMEAARSRLNPGGVYCQWLPNYVLESGDVQMMYKTMSRVYPRVDVWAINFPDDPESELLMVGYTQESDRSTNDVHARFVKLMPPFAAENEVVTPQTLTVYSGMQALEASKSDPDVPLNTDDHSTLEYRVFWNLVNNVIMQDGN
ncbi:MAG: spermidine synthase [Coriobacteriia bacterium]